MLLKVRKFYNAHNTYNINAFSFYTKKFHCLTLELLLEKQKLFDVRVSLREFFRTSKSTLQK